MDCHLLPGGSSATARSASRSMACTPCGASAARARSTADSRVTLPSGSGPSNEPASASASARRARRGSPVSAHTHAAIGPSGG